MGGRVSQAAAQSLHTNVLGSCNDSVGPSRIGGKPPYPVKAGMLPLSLAPDHASEIAMHELGPPLLPPAPHHHHYHLLSRPLTPHTSVRLSLGPMRLVGTCG